MKVKIYWIISGVFGAVLYIGFPAISETDILIYYERQGERHDTGSLGWREHRCRKKESDLETWQNEAF